MPHVFSGSQLSTIEWMEILQNKELTKDIDIRVLQVLYNFPNHQASGGQIASVMTVRSHGVLNLEMSRYAKRIAKHYDINFIKRKTGTYRWWNLFFNGWSQGNKFIWQLRSEIVEALFTIGLVEETVYPGDLPQGNIDIFEGAKRIITVNSYERNPEARRLCVEYWKAICIVCDFDFEKAYGKIGKGFIHVHHLVPISQIKRTYRVDPIKDLIPVCPNCHAMLHRHDPPLTIKALKALLNDSKTKSK